jgi:pimeloyl-ACP methyl ester carboxylesterase
VPKVELKDATIAYEVHGSGRPLMLLHAGWGTPVNGFELQLAGLAGRFQLLIPDRRGYGRSSRVKELSPDYHRQAAADMLTVLDHAGAEPAFLWGHSDGAVVGAWMALRAPDRVRALAFEGGHLLARKDASRGRALMERVRERPETLPEEMQAALAAGHGADYWQYLLWMWTEAWRLLYQRPGDLYDGRLVEIRCPTLVIHGGQDPHTATREAEQLAAQIPGARTLLIPEGGHSLHDDPALVDRVNAAVLALFAVAETGDDQAAGSISSG